MIQIMSLILLMAVGDDYIRLKNGRTEKGKILQVTEKNITATIASGAEVTLTLEMLDPSYAYDILKKYFYKEKTADNHIKLAEFCRKIGLSRHAVDEYERAKALDKTLVEKIDKEIKDTITEEARVKFEKAKKLVTEAKMEKYKEATMIFKDIMMNYPETPYAEEAKNEDKELAQKIKQLVEDDEKKKAELEKMKTDLEKEKEVKMLQDAKKFLAEARELWNDGLDYETDIMNIGVAAKKWIGAHLKLVDAKKAVENLAKVGKEAEVLKELQLLGTTIDSWMVRVCYTLGRFYVQESDYAKAIYWLNQALKVDPDNPIANTLKLELTLQLIRTRQPK